MFDGGQTVPSRVTKISRGEILSTADSLIRPAIPTMCTCTTTAASCWAPTPTAPLPVSFHRAKTIGWQ